MWYNFQYIANVFLNIMGENEKMIAYIIDNKEWIFSGIGVFAISIIVTILFRNKYGIKQKMKSGDNCINIQSTGTISIGVKEDKDVRINT